MRKENGVGRLVGGRGVGSSELVYILGVFGFSFFGKSFVVRTFRFGRFLKRLESDVLSDFVYRTWELVF